MLVMQRNQNMLPNHIFNPYPNITPINPRRRRSSTDTKNNPKIQQLSSNPQAHSNQLISQKVKIVIKIDRQTNMITIKRSSKLPEGKYVVNSIESRSLPEYVRKQDLYGNIRVRVDNAKEITIVLPEKAKNGE